MNKNEFSDKRDYVEFVKTKLDKFIYDEKYKFLMDFIGEEVRVLKNKLSHLDLCENDFNLKKELYTIVGQIEAYRNILEMPKKFREELEKIAKEKEKDNVKKSYIN